MNRTIGVLKMHCRDKWSWLYIPWIVCLSSFLVNLIIGYTMSSQEEIYTGGVSSIFIYLFVIGIVMPPQTFAFALGMGVRRKDYFLGTTVMAMLFSVGSSVLLLLLSQIEQGTNQWGVGLHFFNLPFINEGSLFIQWLTFTLLFLCLFFGGLLIASVYRKFGKNGMFVFFGAILLVFLVAPLLITYFEGWDDIGRWILASFHSMNDFAPWLLLKAAIMALASYLLLLRSTV